MEAERKNEAFTTDIAVFRHRIIEFKVQVAAIRAGLVDIDAWIFIDLSNVTFNAEGRLEGAEEAIEVLRHAKPNFFKGVTA